jgi:uroporphyrin-III C-methyltransferase
MDRGEFDRKPGWGAALEGEAWSARSPRVGFVSLVGVGPGDPELLTLKAARALAEAEVVAYDELVSEEILALAPPEAERIPVGRRGGGVRHHEVDLHPAVVERARMGKRVVRLKGGDPSIFGRVGEEALVLAEAGVPFEIVPGVSAALGAAASLALPLTHRLVSSAVTFVTAHLAPRADGAPDLERFDRQIADLPKEGTVVFYMGLGTLPHLRTALAKAGWSLATPALAVSKATTAGERAVSGTLDELPGLVEAARLEAPALVVVGQVVAVRERVEGLRAASPVAVPPRERGSAAKLFARLRRRLVKAAA